jgi:hypothetical protein
MDRHTVFAKNNSKYKSAVEMVNVLGKLWLLNWLLGIWFVKGDQCTKFATLTNSAVKTNNEHVYAYTI